jgi:hypothetical protein
MLAHALHHRLEQSLTLVLGDLLARQRLWSARQRLWLAR